MTGFATRVRPGVSVRVSSLLLFAAVAAQGTPVLAQATDLLCNQCVGTGDLDTAAVTNAKIAAGSVTTGKIANSAVTAAKISAGAVDNSKIANSAVNATKLTTAAVTTEKLANNAVNVSKIPNAAVTAGKIADGAVNKIKLADGAVVGAKLAPGAVTPDKLNIANTIFIEDSGSAVDNCTALLDALNGLTGPATVVLGPGTFDCGTTPLIVTSEITLRGAGRHATTIKGSVEGFDGFLRVQGDNVTLEDFRVLNDDSGGAGTQFGALIVDPGTSNSSLNFRLRNLILEALNGDAFTTALRINGSNCDGGRVTDVLAMASSSGFDQFGVRDNCMFGSVVYANLTAIASGGTAEALTKAQSGVLTVKNSRLSGATSSARGSASAGTLRLIASELDGPVSNEAICVGSYDGAGAALVDGANGAGGCVLPP